MDNVKARKLCEASVLCFARTSAFSQPPMGLYRHLHELDLSPAAFGQPVPKLPEHAVQFAGGQLMDRL